MGPGVSLPLLTAVTLFTCQSDPLLVGGLCVPGYLVVGRSGLMRVDVWLRVCV